MTVLVAAYQAATRARGCLRIAGAREAVLRVLQIVGLDTVIDCHPTLDDALNT
ncbi:STAS domain-containing protein [Streptomyces sp. MMBL 11-3]|uniref:STAS domain-containing protein n=1 Tax=Streptomyces sp. MMBL 11-3 TaxID=3382639 RepID=UPI0039B6A084